MCLIGILPPGDGAAQLQPLWPIRWPSWVYCCCHLQAVHAKQRQKKKRQKNPESFAGPQSGAELPRLTAAGIYFPRKWERNAPGTFEEDDSCEGEIRSLEDINDLRVQT